MSRNRNDAMEVLFLLVKDHLEPSFTAGPELEKVRFVNGNIEETNWLTNAKIIETYAYSVDRRFGLVEFEGENYFFVIGFGEPTKTPVGLSRIDTNAGLFVALISDLEIPVSRSISNEYLVENILSQHEDSDQYSGHDFRELVKIFPEVYIAEVTNEFFGDPSNLIQIASYYLASNGSLLDLPFSNECLDELIYLIATNSNILNYENILQALLSSQFKFAFLDLYRCIELLFQVVYIDETCGALGVGNQKLKFLQAIEDTLGWRPVESSALAKIFDGTPPEILKTLNDAVTNYDSNIANIGKWFYALRCSIVHLKTTHKTYEIKIGQWEPLLHGTARILRYWYQIYFRFS